eukprot:2392433-Rhodomonas_salina.1
MYRGLTQQYNLAGVLLGAYAGSERVAQNWYWWPHSRIAGSRSYEHKAIRINLLSYIGIGANDYPRK